MMHKGKVKLHLFIYFIIYISVRKKKKFFDNPLNSAPGTFYYIIIRPNLGKIFKKVFLFLSFLFYSHRLSDCPMYKIKKNNSSL